MNVLIVDDSKMNIRVAEDALNEFHSIKSISTCLNAEEAIGILKNEKIDLILLDIIMPGLSGVDLLKILNRDKILNETRVIMLTTVEDLIVLKDCFDLGATDYIQKPFNHIEFIARVKSVIRDIENDKKLLKALELLERQNKELLRINQTLKDTQFYLLEKEKMTAIGELTNGIIHELELPLYQIQNAVVNIITSVSELDETSSEDQISHCKNRILETCSISEKNIEKIQKLLNNMDNISKESTNQEYEVVKLSDLIEEVLLLLNSEIKEVVTIERKYHENGLVYCNKCDIKLALMHVLINGIYAVKDVEHSKISITTLNTEDSILCVIDDNGVGIMPYQMAKIFNPFYTTKPKHQYLGLGLSIVYDIVVNKHNGNVTVDSEINKKTAITIVLKRVENK